MQYRRFGRSDFRVSALGFGAMRLPTLGESAQIDEPEAIRMIRHAIDNGVNYLDTAYPYHGGNSERVVGKALKDGYRERIRLATKMPVGQVQNAADFDRIFDEQLAKLDVAKVDFYLLHGLGVRGRSWGRVRDLGVIAWAEKQIAAGRIGALGFSFHADTAEFKHIVDGYDNWALAQVQYNFMDVKNQAGTEGVKYAAARGIPIVVMEPLLGGSLATPSDFAQAIYDAAPAKRTPVDWALQWVWDQPEVSTVLSGMSTFQQVVENLASADRSEIGSFTADDQAIIARVRDAYNSVSPIPCTQCRYCMPCPNGVDIPQNFLSFNRAVIYNQYAPMRMRYGRIMPEEKRAKECVQCRECEEKCPQAIKIGDWMPIVHDVLGEGAEYQPSMRP
jgi:uncharacterized protein